MRIAKVETKQGAVRGVEKQGYSVYRGIPYAKAPVGELRFCPPQAPEAWEGVRDCSRFGARSMQADQPEGSFYQKEFFADEDFLPPASEDSLYLNIWTPAQAETDRLPVAFWIHGGAFTGGFGSEMEFDGAAFCRKGVILVTVNYRMGVFGFLAHPWLSKRGGQGAANNGLLDQAAALRWVRENIAGFGGDPARITAFGQSAGSISVQALLSSRQTGGMIAGAILQSAAGYKTGVNRDRSVEEAEAIGVQFTDFASITSCGQLLAMPAQDLSRLTGQFFMRRMQEKVSGLPFAPVIDGAFLTEGFDAVIEKGLHPDIPYMIGSTKNDLGVTPEMLQSDTKSPLYEGCVNWSLRNEALGRRPSYVYYFTRQLLGDDQGAFHSSELWYEFGTLERSWRPKEPADYALSERMVAYWTNFIKTGDPNAEGLPDWKPCTAETRYVRELS